MKVTMYMDVPPYHAEHMNYWAQSKPMATALAPGWRRVAFQVEIPTKAWDEVAPPEQSFDVPPEGGT